MTQNVIFVIQRKHFCRWWKSVAADQATNRDCEIKQLFNIQDELWQGKTSSVSNNSPCDQI